MTPTSVENLAPFTRSEAAALAAAEYVRFADLLDSLDDDDWAQPSDCPPWDARAVAGHCVGMMSDLTSLRSVIHRLRSATREAKKTGAPLVDAMSAQQVADQAALSGAELVARAKQNGPVAARWRAKVPGLLRRIPSKETVGGQIETWRLGYLLDTILTRDTWMHRVDISRATGRDMVLTPEHDGRIVADVVAEWARRHGRPFTLTLTGAAGGEYSAGSGGDAGEHITIEAVEFCRTLSGRATGSGLLEQEVPF